MHPNSPALSRRDAVRFLGLAGFAALLPSFADRARAAETAPTAAAAPSLAGEQAGYFRFKIGDLEAVAINDGGFGGPLEQSPWPGGDRAKLNGDLTEAFLPPDRFGIPINVLLVRLGSELVLVDAGCGALFGPTNGKLRARLAAIGVQPEHITGVILTHTHADHFGGLFEADGTPVFTRAQHFIHRREFEFWTGALAGTPVSIAKADSAAGAQRALQALKGKWQLVAPGDKLVDGLELIDAPGHTPGHIALEFASGQDRLLHVVDIAHHHVISFANPELPIAFDVQTPEAIATRRKLLDRAAADRARIFGTHLPFPCLGHVRRRGAAYEHVLEPTPAA